MAHVERTAEVAWSGTIARGTGMASGVAAPSEGFRSHSHRDSVRPRARQAPKS
jgi:hypothetical protein